MSWIQGLNPEQAKAVMHDHGPLLILAGAGSGKTTVLVSRTGRMIAEGVVSAQQVCVLTFTNKAARELKHRVAAKVGRAAKGIWAGTFHSFGLQLLRKYHKEAGLPKNFGIMDSSDAQSIVKDLLKEIRVVGKDKFDLEKVVELMNELRVKGRAPLKATDEYDEVAEVLLPKYLKKMELLGVVDFEGLLLKPLELFKHHPAILHEIQTQFQQVMVDEFQDTNDVQMQLIERMVRSHRNIAVVGDDDQSIYGWRGAVVSNILDFPKNFPPCEVIRLERNYRSTPEILNIANEVIAKNQKRHGKVLKAQKELGLGKTPEVFVVENEEEESELVAQEIHRWKREGFEYKDIAVLYRSNGQGGWLEANLRRHMIPHQVSGGTSFFDRKEVKDILAYLRCSLGTQDVSLRRIINVPSRGIGDVSVESIDQYATENKMSFWKAALDWRRACVAEKVGESIDALFRLVEGLAARIMNPSSNATAGEELLKFLMEIGYQELVYKSSDDPLVCQKRWMMIEVFSRVLDGFVQRGARDVATLKDFVDAMELRDDVESEYEKDKNKVSLMTLHACKGLEFPAVIMVGLEEDILPHKTLGSDIDEERRLFYVGITRAQRELVMSRAQFRKRHGSLRPSAPSRFLLEVSPGHYQHFPDGVRPVSGAARESLLQNFLAGLDQKIQSKS